MTKYIFSVTEETFGIIGSEIEKALKEKTQVCGPNGSLNQHWDSNAG